MRAMKCPLCKWPAVPQEAEKALEEQRSGEGSSADDATDEPGSPHANDVMVEETAV